MKFFRTATARVVFLDSIMMCVMLLFFIPVTHAATLVKTRDSSTIYYLTGESARHAFPNEATYRSWYGTDYSKIAVVSPDFLAKIPLKKNITFRPGTSLIKVPTDSKVYAVEPGGVIRHLTDSVFAEALFGPNWTSRVVDVPEVFFENYIIGDPINRYGEIPDGVVYQLPDDPTYFWKIDNILWPFASAEAVRQNGYDPKLAVKNNQAFYRRGREIAGPHDRLLNAAVSARQRNADCESAQLKGAFVLVTKDQYTLGELEKVEAIKKRFEPYFTWATQELSTLDLSYPTIPLQDTGYFTQSLPAMSELRVDEVAQTFYDTNEDVFDFIFVFPDFDVLTGNEQAHFIPVTNRLDGIGRPLLEAGERFGSRGKLKGVVVMDNLSEYDLASPSKESHLMNLLLHEVMHQWGAYLQFNDAASQPRQELLQQPDLQHWNFYVNFLSPLGGGGWQDNGNGTYTSLTSQLTDSLRKPLSDLDLYTMGLLPKQAVKPLEYLITDPPQAPGNTIWAKGVTVTPDQIIAAHGKVRCVL